MLKKYDSLFILKFTFRWVSYFYLLNLATQTLKDLVYWTELVVEVLEAGGRPKKTRGGWKGEASGMVDMAHQPSFRLPQSPGGGQRAHSEPEEKPLPQPAGEQKPEDPQVSREQGPEVTGPPKAEGRGGRRAREIFLLPGWRSEHPAIHSTVLLLGVGGPRFLGCQPHATSVTRAPSLPKPPSSDSSEQKLGLQQEATVTFLFTLLSTTEPTKDPAE